MGLIEVIASRRSIRRYTEEDVPDGLIRNILELARDAPSAGAIRGYKAIISRKKLTRYNSPVSLVICAIPAKYVKRYGARGKKLYAIQDATIYAAYVQLIATNAGLDSCWVGAFREEKIKKALELDDSLNPIAIILLGYRS